MTMTDSMKDAVARHPEVVPKPVSIGGWLSRFGPSPPNSVRALRIKMGPFTPETDAFQFINLFSITEEDARQFRRHLGVFSRLVIGAGVRQVADALAGVSVPVPWGSVSLPGVIVDTVIGEISEELAGDIPGKILDTIVAVMAGHAGRCGGMAFAGYDFYLLGWPVDYRLGTSPPSSGVLGDYIFQRLLDSLDRNGLTFMTWLMDYYILPSTSVSATSALVAAAAALGGPVGVAIAALIGSRIDFFGLGGAPALLDKTKDEWGKIKATLDQVAAWPIGIIFSDSISPIDQHQILATGYTDAGDGTATLTVWDNNEGKKSRVLNVDFRGDELQVENFLDDRPVKGIFLEDYSPATPPASLRLPAL